MLMFILVIFFFFFQAEDGIRDRDVTGVQTCALPILGRERPAFPTPAPEATRRRAAHGLGLLTPAAPGAGAAAPEERGVARRGDVLRQRRRRRPEQHPIPRRLDALAQRFARVSLGIGAQEEGCRHLQRPAPAALAERDADG